MDELNGHDYSITVSGDITVPLAIQYSNAKGGMFLTVRGNYPPNVDKIAHLAEEELKLREFVDTNMAKRFDELNLNYKQLSLNDKHITIVDNQKLIHVTAALSLDFPTIKWIEEYIAQGVALDEVGKIYGETKKIVWVEPAPTPHIKQPYEELYAQFIEFLQSPKVELIDKGEFLMNKDFGYCGTPDFLGKYDGVSAIFDFKRSVSKDNLDKYYSQMSAYCKAISSDIEVMVLISPDGIAVDGNIDFYFQKFLVELGRFKERYGIN